MSRCILSVARGEKYEKMTDVMIESFLRYNRDWNVERIYGNSIKVPVKCLENGMSGFDCCEIGRWVAILEMLKKYDEVLYCDGDLYWYDEYKVLESDIVLSPHYITDEAKRIARNPLFFDGTLNEGVVYMRKSTAAFEACSFIVDNVAANPKYFIYNNSLDFPRNGKLWLQGMIGYIPYSFTETKVDENAGMNVAFWNLKYQDRKLLIKNNKYFVECGGKEYPLVSFHFSSGSIDLLPHFGNEVTMLLNEYRSSAGELKK